MALRRSTPGRWGYDQAIERAETTHVDASAIDCGYDRVPQSPMVISTTKLSDDGHEHRPAAPGGHERLHVYGRPGMGVEQINNTTGTVTYLHHDQAGSTRLLTGSTGTVTGKCSYNAYGTDMRRDDYDPAWVRWRIHQFGHRARVHACPASTTQQQRSP